MWEVVVKCSLMRVLNVQAKIVGVERVWGRPVDELFHCQGLACNHRSPGLIYSGQVDRKAGKKLRLNRPVVGGYCVRYHMTYAIVHM